MHVDKHYALHDEHAVTHDREDETMTHAELKREYAKTMRRIHQTDPRSDEWERLWSYINEIMYEWKHTKRGE